MNDQPIIENQAAASSNKNHKGLKIFGVVVLIIFALVSVGYSVYAWQQNNNLASNLTQKENDNKELVKENISLRESVENNKEEPTLTDKELAQKAAQNFVDAEVLDAKYVATSPEIKGSFASSGVTSSGQPGRILSGLLLKKVNESWIVIHHGQNGPSQDTITRFAVPEEFRSN